MLRDLLFASGAILSAATQLRFGGLPVGIAEVLLALWLGLFVFRWIHRPLFTINTPTLRLAAFWVPLAASLCIGAIVGFAVETFIDWAGMLHDIIAYGLMLCVSFALVMELTDGKCRRRMSWVVALIGAAYCLTQLALGFGLLRVPLGEEIEPWFFDRLRGWSKDPNQLGFMAAALSFILVHLAATSTRRFAQTAAIVLLSYVALTGFMTKSDSFIVAIVGGALVFLAVYLLKMARTPSPQLGFGTATIAVMVLALPLVIVSIIPFSHLLIHRVETFSEAVYNEDGQGETRMQLWKESVSKGLESYLVGFGPGPHLTGKSWKRPPPDKFESHNAPLHLLTQGGMLAVLAFLWLFATALLDAARARLPALAALATCFFIFSFFHVVYRFPLFWFGITLCFLEAAAIAAIAVRTRPGPRPGKIAFRVGERT